MDDLQSHIDVNWNLELNHLSYDMYIIEDSIFEQFFANTSPYLLYIISSTW